MISQRLSRKTLSSLEPLNRGDVSPMSEYAACGRSYVRGWQKRWFVMEAPGLMVCLCTSQPETLLVDGLGFQLSRLSAGAGIMY